MNSPILVLAEPLRGDMSEATYETLGAGRRLADAMRTPLSAACLARDAVALATRLGAADQVYAVDTLELSEASPRGVADALVAVMERHEIRLVLVPGSNVSMGIGSMLSARTALPFVNFCRHIECDDAGLRVTSQLCGGKILADLRLPDASGILSLCPGMFSAEAGRKDRTPPVEVVTTPPAPLEYTFAGYLEPEKGDVDITKATVLVAVGRGIQDAAAVGLAQELATTLGGAVCASRPVIDQGWLPLSRQVGKSGMTVKPRLYLAFGISGAPEHWEGMQNSQLIVAINTDPAAPIFEAAHYGLVGDALEILPLLTERLQAREP